MAWKIEEVLSIILKISLVEKNKSYKKLLILVYKFLFAIFFMYFTDY